MRGWVSDTSKPAGEDDKHLRGYASTRPIHQGSILVGPVGEPHESGPADRGGLRYMMQML